MAESNMRLNSINFCAPRQSKHTVMLFDKKYYDVDMCKFIKDKINSIHSYQLSEIIDDHVHNNMHHYHESYDYYRDYDNRGQDNETWEDRVNYNIYNIPKFLPKDNDFDKEEKKLAEQKCIEESNRKFHEQLCMKQQAEVSIEINNPKLIKNSWVKK